MENTITQERPVTELTIHTHDDSYFESKEHYLNFRNSWKQFIADGKHKCTTYEDSRGGICKHQSDLTSIHHFIYGGLRKRNLHKSFSDESYESNLLSLSAVLRYRFDWLTKVFGNTVTKDMIEQLIQDLS